MKLSSDEANHLSLGGVRYRSRLEALKKAGKSSSSPFGAKIIESALRPVTEGIKESLEFLKTKPVLDEELMAFVGISVVLNTIQPDLKIGTLGHHVGKAIIAECHAAEFKLKANLSRTQLVSEIRKHKPKKYKKSFVLKLGSIVLAAIFEKTGLLVFEKKKIGNKVFRVISPSQDLLHHYDNFVRDNEFSEPLRRPLTSWPIQFDDSLVGGAAFDTLANTSSLKYKDKEHLKKIKESGDLDKVKRVMDSTQVVPYCIDNEVLDVAWELFTTNKAVAGLPGVLETLPNIPDGLEKGEKAIYMSKYFAAKKRNDSLTGKRLNAARTLTIAREYKDTSHFYFPVFLDFRGRIYYHGDHLQPQSTDLGKSLLQFNSKDTIENDFFYLVHGANCYGADKLSYIDRYNFIKRKKKEIQSIVDDPIGNQILWVDTDSPFSYLAFCFDVVKYWKDPEGHESGLRICCDASSSGMQILSLLLRDEQGCKRTNVLPNGTDEPCDIYLESIDVLGGILTKDAQSGLKPVSEHAKYWLNMFKGKPVRSLVKRILMTTVYALSDYGLRQYVMEWISANRKVSDTDYFKHDQYLCRRVKEAVRETVHGASVCMDYIQAVTKKLADHGQHLELTLPNGFHMINHYVKQEGKRIKTRTQGNLYYINFSTPGTEINRKRAINASVANVTHSLDACILYDIVEKIPNSIPFSLLHDSLYYRASDVDIFYEQIRASTCSLFTSNLLKDFKEQIEEKTGVKLPKLPKQGEINMEDIISSDYLWN